MLSNLRYSVDVKNLTTSFNDMIAISIIRYGVHIFCLHVFVLNCVRNHRSHMEEDKLDNFILGCVGALVYII